MSIFPLGQIGQARRVAADSDIALDVQFRLKISLFLLEGDVVALKIAVSEEELSVAIEERLARLLAEAESHLIAVSDVVSVNA